MTISFRYKAIKRPVGTLVKTPSIPVTLSGRGNIRIETEALVDSGADLSVIPKDIAELLSISLEGETEVSRGIGGEVKVLSSKINVNLKKGHESYDIIAPVQIVLGDNHTPILLGREGFFNNFKITFDQLKERISLKKN